MRFAIEFNNTLSPPLEKIESTVRVTVTRHVAAIVRNVSRRSIQMICKFSMYQERNEV